jgi:predicted dehydrogenase
MPVIAVVGAGYWGPNHIRVLQSMPACRVIAVDKDAARLEKIGHDFTQVRCMADYDAVLRDPEVSAVVVATPTTTHYEVVRKALEAKKHVLCEKPLCAELHHAAALVDLAEKNSLVLMTGHIFLFNPGIRRIKQLIGEGELGDMLYLSATRTNLGPIRSDVNAAFDLASHDISIFNWLLDSVPASVSATGGAFVQESIHDVVFLSLRYPGNIVAQIHASWLNPKKVRDITVVGTRRMATWDDLQLGTPVAIYDRGANVVREPTSYGEFLRISMWDGDVRLPKVPGGEPLKSQDEAFVKSLGDGKCAISDGRFSLGVIQVLEAASRSLKEHGRPIDL